MPSSGYPMECFTDHKPEDQGYINAIESNARHAMESGMFIEWLECFIGAYHYLREDGQMTERWRAANIASQAGIEEWDL